MENETMIQGGEKCERAMERVRALVLSTFCFGGKVAIKESAVNNRHTGLLCGQKCVDTDPIFFVLLL